MVPSASCAGQMPVHRALGDGPHLAEPMSYRHGECGYVYRYGNINMEVCRDPAENSEWGYCKWHETYTLNAITMATWVSR